MSLSKSPLPFIVSYDVFGLNIGHFDYMRFVACIIMKNMECYSLLTCLGIFILAHTSLLISVCAILASTTSPLH